MTCSEREEATAAAALCSKGCLRLIITSARAHTLTRTHTHVLPHYSVFSLSSRVNKEIEAGIFLHVLVFCSVCLSRNEYSRCFS